MMTSQNPHPYNDPFPEVKKKEVLFDKNSLLSKNHIYSEEQDIEID